MKRLIVIALFALSPLAVNAHDVDATPSPEVTDVVNVPPVDQLPVEVTEAAPNPPPVVVVNNPASNEIPMSVVNIFYVVIATILTGGGLLVIISRLLENKQARDNAEKLFLAQSPEAQRHQRELFEMLSGVTLKLIDFLDKSTDGQPNEEIKSLSSSANSSTKGPVG